MNKLELKTLEIQDEKIFVEALAIRNDSDTVFALYYELNMNFENYLKVLNNFNNGVNLPKGHVPSTLFFGFVNGHIIGRSSIRHTLNSYLERVGGHIGYITLEPYRNRGYAKEMLRLSLVYSRSIGLKRVLLTCDDNNIASIRTIESQEAILENMYFGSDVKCPKRRYWIDL